MLKFDYLKLCLLNKLYYKKAWIFSIFSLTKEGNNNKTNYPYKLKSEPWGYSFYDTDGNVQKIDDGIPNVPLFHVREVLTIDGTWIPNLNETMETTMGNLLFNYISIVTPFGKKIPYLEGEISVPMVENMIAPKLRDKPLNESDRKDEFFYTDELNKFTDTLELIKDLSPLFVISATPKNILSPPGVKEFKEKLLKKYGGLEGLKDPVTLSKYEAELLKFDDDYLADDPSNNIFIAGKVKNVARKKMYLSVGHELTFSESLEARPQLNSLEEGWATDPESLANTMNSTRFASYSRGKKTVDGGVTFKFLQRAGSNYVIVDGDCGTKLGIVRRIYEDNSHILVGKTIMKNGQLILIENKTQAANYIGSVVEARDPAFCKSEPGHICTVCAGARLAINKGSISISFSEISWIILLASLKIMHGTVLSTKKMDLKRALSGF